ncbi:hypothetical protein DFH09DRAFT_1409337, partial [Mycena vulgaris]
LRRCATASLDLSVLPRLFPPPSAAVCSPCRCCSNNLRFIQSDYLPPLRPSPMRLAFIRSPPSRASSAARPRAASSDDGWVANTTTSKYASHLHDKGHRRCHISAAPTNGLHSRCHSTVRSPILRVPSAPRHKSRATRGRTLAPTPTQTPTSSASRAPPPVLPTKRVRSSYPPSPRPRLAPSSCPRSHADHRARVLALTHHTPPAPGPRAPHPSPARRGRRRQM